ncbi:exodeoxyribonuclease VII large subunit [Acidothermaceae bacterium B102]|nr:exodeoxyribonuclease VII large subunit [Acidothermaceae bacterium B102]
MPLESTADNPIPVRSVAKAIGDWVARLGRVWIEGQLTEISKRPGTNTAFLTLRDPIADMSLQLTCPRGVVESVQPPLEHGARVAVWAKPEFYHRRGSLSLTVFEIRPIGVGELLARIERLKTLLASEGLFAADRKKPLPFLPRSVGLICGRGSAAERDVIENAKRRWPAVHFTTEEVAVQGPYAVNEVIDAIARLDKDPEVDVIVITRGGGSVEDLLPFSDEAMCRAVSACRTPVISAIGHEPDSPLLDFVADFRASTPTDAGKKVVPDVAEELARVTTTRDRGRRAIVGKVDREATLIASLRSRPVMSDPDALLRSHSDLIDSLRDRARRRFTAALDHAANDLDHTRARVVALSPAATLERGYAVVQRADGSVVRDPVEAEERLTVRVAGGRFDVTSLNEGAA